MSALQTLMPFDHQRERWKIIVNGIVQGVGFRPLVYRLARSHHLSGFVANTSQGVEIEVEGAQDEVLLFLEKLENNAPPLAEISDITSQSIPLADDETFSIRSSDGQGRIATQVSPDAAVCSECFQELFNPEDRRYRYPFINCTNCGPRYTIIENIPYDRPSTSMRGFAMCSACRAEYDDPAGRRFHAQPNCCPECGPQLTLYAPGQKITATGNDAITEAVDLLRQGHILAIKGLGGFHLAVDAANDAAVLRLRQRKGRDEKPFAVMAADLMTAHQLCVLHEDEEQVLLSVQSPILLAEKNDASLISESIAPGNDMFGIMLPYTPLHHLLFDGRLKVLVMTSANLSEEPICIDNQEAFNRLTGIADYVLAHNRDIYLRNDDSVVVRLGGRLRSVRRSRGYAPSPISGIESGSPVLGVGGELKNTICLLRNDHAIFSQHIGDLKNLECYLSFQKTIHHLQLLFETRPKLVVHDLHPGYLSTRWAIEQKEAPSLAVQHHHAHLASCLAENRFERPAIGLIMDGTGYGDDGTIWGGEVLVGDYQGYERFAFFEPMPLPGGDAAIASPWRTAVAYLVNTFGQQDVDLDFLDRSDTAPVIEMIEKDFNSPRTSSCGRLFDAVAVIAGSRQEIRYEAQAAIELMQAARGIDEKPYPFRIIESGGARQMSVQAIIRAVMADRQAGVPQSTISGRFHRTLVNLLTETAKLARRETGIKTVALSGGVFQNRLLFEGLLHALRKDKFDVLTHSRVPSNDGCIALGQAVIGRKYLKN